MGGTWVAAHRRSLQPKIADRAIQHQLSRILASRTFAQVERLKRFIGFIVEETLAGRGTSSRNT